jgi:hypothetical protein
MAKCAMANKWGKLEEEQIENNIITKIGCCHKSKILNRIHLLKLEITFFNPVKFDFLITE